MGEQAIYALASQQVPIQGIKPLFNSADYKKNLAMKESAELADRIRGNVVKYNQRMAEFAQKRYEQNKADAEAEMNKRYEEILNMGLYNSNDLYKLKQGQNKLSSLFGLGQSPFIKLGDDRIYAAKNLFRQNAERLNKIKQGEEADNGNRPVYAASEFQDVGKRDFLT